MARYTENKHGIRVRCWCASCLYKELTRAVTVRRCSKHHKDVKPTGYCKHWQMSHQLEQAGLVTE